MIIVVGSIIVLVSVLSGFAMAGGSVYALLHVSELIIIGGAALGSLVIMSPRKVLIDMGKKSVQALRGSPYGKKAYQELLAALYEMFLFGRRKGMVPLEEHLTNPQTSGIFTKYPSFVHNKHAMDFLCNAMQPIVDGRIKSEQLKSLLEVELNGLEVEHNAPVNVLGKTADALPGFGIVAAVLGIVVTMAAIAGPVETVGEKVAAALVGTFLGILMSYGFVGPLAMKLEFLNAEEMAYFQCIATSVVGFVNGMAPNMAVETARRGLNSELRPSAKELEEMIKTINSTSQKG
jgi:chemotaxis protein MotA